MDNTEIMSSLAFGAPRVRCIRQPSAVASGLDDLIDLRLVIAAALGASPVYEPSLRRSVRTYVGAERDEAAAPGHVIDVIIVLTDLIEKANIAPLALRQALARRVIVWCVEAYFGPIDGDTARRDGDALSDAPLRAASRLASIG
jgi:hypothetical protein